MKPNQEKQINRNPHFNSSSPPPRRLSRFLARVAVLSCCLILTATSTFGAVDKRPLHRWFSSERNDYYTTARETWRGSSGEVRFPDYHWVGTEGYVLSPDDNRAGTRLLYQWWHSGHGDYRLTSDPAWGGSVGDLKDGYRLLRIVGRVYEQPLAGTIPLDTTFSSEHNDYITTTSPAFGPVIDLPLDYARVRREGYIYPPIGEHYAEKASFFGYGAHAPEESRPLLIVRAHFEDRRVTATEANIQDLFFGADTAIPSIARIFGDISEGVFQWTLADIVTVTQPFTSTSALTIVSSASSGLPASTLRSTMRTETEKYPLTSWPSSFSIR